MAMQVAPDLSRFRTPKETIGNLDPDTAARVVAASSDVAMVIDRQGIIRDIAVSNSDMPMDGFADILQRRWVDTVALESRHKVEEMLRDAGNRDWRWREVNQQISQGTIPLRYVALDAGQDGNVIALGRDLRSAAALQQRLLQAQQSMERDYVRLRQAETRYRLLFQISSEAVLIVDPVSKKIVDANPAAANLLGMSGEALAGLPFARLFRSEARDAAHMLLRDSSPVGRTEPLRVRLADGRGEIAAMTSQFRQDGSVHVLVRLSTPGDDRAPADGDSNLKLLRVLNRIPDAFVITDEALNMLDVNMAFLELSQLPSAEAAKGQNLGHFIGRTGIDINVLIANLREHGSVRNFATIFQTVYGSHDDIEVSAVLVREGLETFIGFVMRAAKRVVVARPGPARELPRTGEELTELVGRVSLREIVRETTDVIERMCIEAALNLTKNNRASAAEVLGLSRQSLYVKLNRYGLDGSEPEALAGG